MAARKIEHSESLKAYRRKLANEEYKVKRILRGKLLWPSTNGTYERSKHGSL